MHAVTSAPRAGLARGKCTETAFFSQAAKTAQWGKHNLFHRWPQDNRTSTCKRKKTHPTPLPHALGDSRLETDQ